jgi:alpha-D-ribose 1-methylphosphonate 5-triphosphate synthase subunit PhnI
MDFATHCALEKRVSAVTKGVNGGQLLSSDSKKTALAANSCFISGFPATSLLWERAGHELLSMTINDLLRATPANSCFISGQLMI